MNKQIKLKDFFITAFALFGFFTVISSFTNVSDERNDFNVPVYEMHKMKNSKIMIFNKQNGEITYKEIDGDYASDAVDVFLQSWPFGDLDVSID